MRILLPRSYPVDGSQGTSGGEKASVNLPYRGRDCHFLQGNSPACPGLVTPQGRWLGHWKHQLLVVTSAMSGLRDFYRNRKRQKSVQAQNMSSLISPRHVMNLS